MIKGNIKKLDQVIRDRQFLTISYISLLLDVLYI